MRQITPEDIVESQKELLKKSQEYFGAFNERCEDLLEGSEEEEEEEE